MPCRLWIKKESQPVFSSNKPSWTDKPWAVWNDGDTLDWAQTSKQINHIKVNKSLTGRTGPDSQRLIDGMVHTQKSQEKKGEKKNLIWILSLWLTHVGSARVLLVTTQLSPQVLLQSSSAKPTKISICWSSSSWRTFTNMSRAIHFNLSHYSFNQLHQACLPVHSS